MTEVEICAVVRRHLEAQGCRVYSEVSNGAYGSGHCADLVALRPDSDLHLIEAKRHASLALLGVADWWLGMGAAAFVSVAAPCPRGFAYQGLEVACRRLGIGFLAVLTDKATQLVEPQRRDCPQTMRTCLYEGQIDGLAAGSAAGQRWTAFRETCNNVARFLESVPERRARPISITPQIAHHYASDRGAASTLIQVVRRGLVPRVSLEYEGRRCWLRLDSTPLPK